MPKVQLLTQYLKNVKGFDTMLKNAKFVSASDGNCVAVMKITEDYLNAMGTMHGGFAATLVDSVSSYGLFTLDSWAVGHVSVNISLSYMQSAKLNDEIKIISKVMRAGKTMAFLDVEIRNAATDKLLVKAEHTKYKFV